MRYTEDGTINPKTRIWGLEDKVMELENELANLQAAQVKRDEAAENNEKRKRMELEVKVEKLEGEVAGRDKVMVEIKKNITEWQDKVRGLRKYI